MCRPVASLNLLLTDLYLVATVPARLNSPFFPSQVFTLPVYL